MTESKCVRCNGAGVDTYVNPGSPTGFTERPCPACQPSVGASARAIPDSLRDEILTVCKQVDMTMHREENYYRPGVGARPTIEDWKERIRWMYTVLLKVLDRDASARAIAPQDTADIAWDNAIKACGDDPEWGKHVAVSAHLIKRIEELAQPLNECEALANELDEQAQSLESIYTTFPWGSVRRAAELLRESARKADAVDPQARRTGKPSTRV